jgi:hypothetical protein
MRWFRENDAYLESLGVKKILASTKNNWHDGKAGLIFKRLGYTPIETVWTRMIL